MKNIFSFLVLVIFCSTAVFSQNTAVEKPAGATAELKEKAFDFGNILQGRPASHEFQVINTGKDTLRLENVQASCGCTTPVWKKDPVAPGGSTTVTVGYNSAAEGTFEKSVNIFYNGNQVKSLVIKGNVYKSPATPVPVNTSIGMLKQIN